MTGRPERHTEVVGCKWIPASRAPPINMDVWSHYAEIGPKRRSRKRRPFLPSESSGANVTAKKRASPMWPEDAAQILVNRKLAKSVTLQ